MHNDNKQSDFFARLEGRCREIGSVLCIGLDPRFPSVPDDPYEAIIQKNGKVIDATLPYASAYKPNIAFYEQFGIPGLEALKWTIERIPSEVPVILDAKRGDIGSTSEAYAKAVFDWLCVDGVTLSPYLGREAISPFLDRTEKGCFVLCRTTNPGSDVFQNAGCGGAEDFLYLEVARECSRWGSNVGLVVAGNNVDVLRDVRAHAPDSWFLAPGIGAQGGSAADAVEAGSRSDGLGLLVSVSRGVSEAEDPGAAAKALRDEIEAARSGPAARNGSSISVTDGAKRRLLTGLVSCGAFRTGKFTLKSGLISPFYIDLRLVPSEPELFRLAGECYRTLLEKLDYVSIAGIPSAGMPLGASAALSANRPMIYPRLDAKSHGAKRRVEGIFSPGDRVVLLDDLITTGGAKIEAAEVLRGEGLVVEDLVVLIERGDSGRKELEKAGIRLHAFARVEELFDVTRDLGMIADDGYQELLDFVHDS